MTFVHTLVSAIAILTTVGTPALAGPTAETFRIPERIDRTGQADVTTQLQQFLDSVPDGSVVEFPKKARYRVEGTLLLFARKDLTFEGNGATVFATAVGEPDRSQWYVNGGARLVFRDLIVRGANPQGGIEGEAYREDLEAQHAFRFVAARDVELDGVTVTDVYGDFVYIGMNNNDVWSQNIWIHESSFARNGRQGIAITAARNVVIEDNDIRLTRRSTIDLEPNTDRGGVENIHILDNRVGQGRLLFLASHGDGPVNNVVVSGNKLDGRVLNIDVVPAEDDRRARFWVTDNASSTAAERSPMRFWQIDGLVVRDNRQRVERAGEVGVILNGVCGAVVGGNDFGSGTDAVRADGDPCDASISARPPPPPPIAGRADTDREKEEEEEKKDEKEEREERGTGAGAPSAAREDDGDEGSIIPWVAAGVPAAVLASALVLYRRRAGGRDRTGG
jgi:hypothetical protein